MNTIFLGSQIIRIPQTSSTNGHLLQLSNTKELAEGSIMVTDHQTQGRGMADNSWESEPGANLTFSIILYPSFLENFRQFLLSKAISLAVFDFLSEHVSDVSIKWPNDVYVGQQKITGILIENFSDGAHLNKTIVGIGVNINQMQFLSDAPNPVSLQQLTGKIYPLENCLKTLHSYIAARYQMMKEDAKKLDADYLQHLYRFGEINRYSANGLVFEARIMGVNNYGMLEMMTTSGEYKVFGYKEVVFE